MLTKLQEMWKSCDKKSYGGNERQESKCVDRIKDPNREEKGNT